MVKRRRMNTRKQLTRQTKRGRERGRRREMWGGKKTERRERWQDAERQILRTAGISTDTER